MQQFRDSWRRTGSMLCVGLDPVLERFPDALGKDPSALRAFNREIIQATSEFACCYKPNLGFYLPFGHHGLDALMALREDVPAEIPILLDAKVGDIDTTSEAYAQAYFDQWGFDGVTAQPFLGHDSLAPLIARQDRAVFILAKTSNPGSGFLQDEQIDGRPVSLRVTEAAVEWNTSGNIGLVAGATYPEQLGEIRRVGRGQPNRVPGGGAHGRDHQAAVHNGLDSEGYGLLINASRAICYASSGSDFAEAAHQAARRLRDEIEEARQQAILQTV